MSADRLREFARLSPCERLRWVEECSTFVRLGQQAMREVKQTAPAPEQGD